MSSLYVALGTLALGVVLGWFITFLATRASAANTAAIREKPGKVDLKKLSKKERRKLKKSSTEWITCDIVVAKEEAAYRRAVVENVKKTDNVLEIGFHVGVTTDIIAKHANSSFGVDSSEFSITEAKNRFGDVENVKFLCADASDKRAVSKYVKEHQLGGLNVGGASTFDVVFIDVSGNRSPGYVLDLLEGYDRIFRPRMFVIKNFKLQNFVQQCISY